MAGDTEQERGRCKTAGQHHMAERIHHSCFPPRIMEELWRKIWCIALWRKFWCIAYMNRNNSCRYYSQLLLHQDLPPLTVMSQLLLRLRGEHVWYTFSGVRRCQRFLVILIEQPLLNWKNGLNWNTQLKPTEKAKASLVYNHFEGAEVKCLPKHERETEKCMLMKGLSHLGHGKPRCCNVGNWTHFFCLLQCALVVHRRRRKKQVHMSKKPTHNQHSLFDSHHSMEQKLGVIRTLPLGWHRGHQVKGEREGTDAHQGST